MTLPTKLTYQPSGNTFELYDPDAPDETAGLGEVDDEAVAREICERWNGWTDLDHALKSRSVVDKFAGRR